MDNEASKRTEETMSDTGLTYVELDAVSGGLVYTLTNLRLSSQSISGQGEQTPSEPIVNL